MCSSYVRFWCIRDNAKENNKSPFHENTNFQMLYSIRFLFILVDSHTQTFGWNVTVTRRDEKNTFEFCPSTFGRGGEKRTAALPIITIGKLFFK